MKSSAASYSYHTQYIASRGQRYRQSKSENGTEGSKLMKIDIIYIWCCCHCCLSTTPAFKDTTSSRRMFFSKNIFVDILCVLYVLLLYTLTDATEKKASKEDIIFVQCLSPVLCSWRKMCSIFFRVSSTYDSCVVMFFSSRAIYWFFALKMLANLHKNRQLNFVSVCLCESLCWFHHHYPYSVAEDFIQIISENEEASERDSHTATDSERERAKQTLFTFVCAII